MSELEDYPDTDFVDCIAPCGRCGKAFVLPIVYDRNAHMIYAAAPAPLNYKRIHNGDMVCPYCRAPYEQLQDTVREVLAKLTGGTITPLPPLSMN